MHHHKYGFLLILIWLLTLSIPAAAQTSGMVILTPLETDDFPAIRSYMEVFDGEGNFVNNLQKEDVTIFEDNRSIPVTELENLETGGQFVVALNLSPTFAIRDSNGISRGQSIQEALTTWAVSHTAPLDDLSFLSNDGPESIHLTKASNWLDAYLSYETDARAALPSLDVLVRAIEVASEPLPREGMGRAILLLTPPPDRTADANIQSFISLAKQEGIRIHVWMVSSPAYFTSQGAVLLSNMANQTGGQFFAYSGDEAIPDIEAYLTPLRYVYALGYESKIRNSEPHEVFIQVNLNGTRLTNEPQYFDLQVLPPNPIFISPPLQIFRANKSALADTLSENAEYTPKEQTLEILVEFPDGRPRPLSRTTLYVDGEIADENTTPPFETFTWDLTAYESSNPHLLQVEVLDSFGLSNISIDNTIQITVQQTPQSVVTTIVKNAPTIAGAAVAVAGGILLLVLVVGGHIRPKTFGRRRKKSKAKMQREEAKDPLTQPIPPERPPSRQRFSKWTKRISWPQRDSHTIKPIAYLETLKVKDPKSVQNQIPVHPGEITFGKAPNQATFSFNDNALDDLHARLVVNGDGLCKIYDEGSIAGTWVNYNPVTSDGMNLKHGDIVHIGRIGLCFKVSDKTIIPKPIVIPLEPGS